ncbi:hypothetical protein MUU77_13335 [Pseudoxanthomonas sp. F37]|jgi:preprotein translocase subunit SecG|uniref:hypothetical protein n=1 Tax=Pseudoxanthomonas TaxID=83618 RepID=UPI001FD6089C|nr:MULTISPECIES: hypothetical protein [Pseudoxanthomonas]UOV06229.1 hypothetical protein MUU75_06095 [Pseudoxanthomonas mexicana]UOV07817.1 hypothetical protein MUU77_13335 [Pseudoxanthomonas sp. F37]
MLAIVLSLVAVAIALMVVFIALQAKKNAGRAAEGAGESATDPVPATHGDGGCASDAGDGGGGD